MAASVSDRVGKRRAALRAAGLRPVQIWAPDSRNPGFAEECRRQGQAVATADLADRDLLAAMDGALTEAAEWTR